jgi:hypothetical protein
VLGARVARKDIGNEVGNTGQGRQGVLMKGRTPGGTAVYWLQGKSTNYLLRQRDGRLATTESAAAQIAKAHIKHGLATDLYPMGPVHLTPRNGSFATAGDTQQIDGIAIAGGASSLDWVGSAVGRDAGLAKQGRLMWGRTATGEMRFWLQGNRSNYMLRDTNGQFITDAASAHQRAKEYIRNSLATDLRPLGLGALSAKNGRVANEQSVQSIDGVPIVGRASTVKWVGGRVGNTDIGRQGLLRWGRTLGGQAVFWLQGRSENRVLRDDGGQLIEGQGAAESRARQLIEHQGMTNLSPFKLR